MTTQQIAHSLRTGGVANAPIFRFATSPAVEVAGKERTLRFCFSDGSLDRAGDTIDPKGWVLDGFLRNPIALWAHASSEPPIGRAVNVGLVGKRLMGDIDFAPPETYDFADTIYRLAKGGYINAVSVGFNPLEWSFVNQPDRPYGIDFKRQELLEVSLVPVPCNENALAEARAKGIDTRPLARWAERALDGAGLTERELRASVRATLLGVARAEFRDSKNEDEGRAAMRRRDAARRIYV
jgi:HK97 family phage prohead protease